MSKKVKVIDAMIDAEEIKKPKLLQFVKNNIDVNKIYKEFELKDSKDIKLKEIKGIYFLVHKKEMYVGKSKYLLGRVNQHRASIVSKKHYNKNFNKWNIKDCYVILLKLDNIDLQERYYINKFNKKYKLINEIIPSYNGDLDLSIFNEYKFKNKLLLRKLDKPHRAIVQKLFNKDIKKSDKSDIHKRKYLYIVLYLKFIKYNPIVEISKIKGFDYLLIFENSLNIYVKAYPKKLKDITIEDLQQIPLQSFEGSKTHIKGFTYRIDAVKWWS